MIAWLLLLLGAGDYGAEARQSYVLRALEAIQKTDAKTLADAANYVSAMERNSCRSDFSRLRVQCLIQRAARNCRGLRDEERRAACTLYSDIIVSNTLSEKVMITQADRYQIMLRSRDYRTALRTELRRIYGRMATDFRLSNHYTCTASDGACIARSVDAYCFDQSDTQNLAWQHCVAALVWFIGTASSGG